MHIIVNKCACCQNNMQHNNPMANQSLIETEEQRNLGITKTKNLKWQKQTENYCKPAVSQQNKVL